MIRGAAQIDFSISLESSPSHDPLRCETGVFRDRLMLVALATCILLAPQAGFAQSTRPPASIEGKKGEWNGFPSVEISVNAKSVLIVLPNKAANTPTYPWVWHGEFFGHRPQPDIELLNRGFHLVYTRCPDMLGSPEAVAHWDKVYAELIAKYQFAPKVALVGLSRGGLYCYNWAVKNPDKVACVYADAAVCDLKSWPGGKGKGKGSPRDWELAKKCYGFNSEAEAMAYQGNPVDTITALARYKVPLLHIYGDADDVVPWDENTGVLARTYQQLGGPITLLAKPGVNHHPHGLEDSTVIVEFIERNTLQQFEK